MFKYQAMYDWMITKYSGGKVEQNNENSNLFLNWKQMMHFMQGAFELSERLEKDFVLNKAEMKIRL